MSDIVERLEDMQERLVLSSDDDIIIFEAVSEIIRLRAENAKLRAALKSFEQIAQYSAVWAADDKVFVPVFIVRAAAAALKENTKGNNES